MVPPVNTSPVLTDFATAITFAENTVNAAPQLLDVDVSFTDAEDNFDVTAPLIPQVMRLDCPLQMPAVPSSTVVIHRAG